MLTAHPGALSLISTFVSLSGHTALIPLDDELIEQAVTRTRPRAAIVDFEHPCAASPRVEQQMTESGTHVILFSAWHRSVEARARAAEMRAMFFALPIDHGDFDTLLRSALSA